MKKLLVALAVAAVGAVIVLGGAAAGPSSPDRAAVGGSTPGTAKIGIQSTTIGTDVNPINGFWNQGWWSSSPGKTNSNSNTNYFVGTNPDTHNNYFTFDITALSAHPCATPQSATLRVHSGSGNLPPNTFLNYKLYGVDTDPFVLSQKDNNPDAAIFNDLGSGPIYGSYFLNTSFVGTFALTLNATALNAIAAAKANGEQFFSIGGALFPNPVAGNVNLFAFTGDVAATLTVNWPFLCRIRPPA